MKDMTATTHPISASFKLLNPIENTDWPILIHEPIIAAGGLVQSTLND